ncbi:MAG TPA: hypothetical protein PL029_09335 [Bacteroidia bacterium]|nr:hypothetical protein [Bacteroidia bacterium]
MFDGPENRDFDISRRDGVTFKHYQILVKLFRDDQTQHHNLDIFTTGPEQLLEMRRVFAKTYQTPHSRLVYNMMKNN